MPAFCLVRAVSAMVRNAGSRAPGLPPDRVAAFRHRRVMAQCRRFRLSQVRPQRACLTSLVPTPEDPGAFRTTWAAGLSDSRRLDLSRARFSPRPPCSGGDRQLSPLGFQRSSGYARPARYRCAPSQKQKPRHEGRGQVGRLVREGKAGSECLFGRLTLPHPAAGPGVAAVAACRSSPSVPLACHGALPSSWPPRPA